VNVVPAASPNPFIFEIFGASRIRAATRGQLAIPAASTDAMHDPSRGHGISKRSLFRRNGENGTKHGGIFHRGAIPFMVSELELTLCDAIAGAASHVHHVISVEHTKFLLPTGQASDLVADPSCTVAVFGAKHKKVGVLQCTHSMHAQIPAKYQKVFLAFRIHNFEWD